MSINGDFGEDFIYAARCSRYQRQNTPISRRPFSTTFQPTSEEQFTNDEIYFFMVIKLKPAQARQILRSDPPPAEFYEMAPVVKAGYLFYYGVYKQHFPYDIDIFIKRFYKEFYKYTCENMSDEEALKKICNHTYKEWQRNNAKAMSESIRALNDGRSTPDSRASLSSYADSDSMSLESAAKEPLKFRTHHPIVKFASGGRLIILAPRESISTVRIDHLKNHIANRSLRRNIELIESFKGPLIFNETQPHTLQLFIERQIREIYTSDVYKGNPDSNDTNDCLLIWRLLQMLIKQQGRVTGPDLAQLLFEDTRLDENVSFFKAKQTLHAQQSTSSSQNDVSSDLVECTNFLLRGCVDEAINSAIREGCLFDALILAESLYASRPDKLAAIRSRLLATRSAQHPLSTLISVAEAKPVPLLASTNTGDGRGWRAHIAILLANLQTSVSYESIYRLGLDLAKKDFNSAADFCFLAVNLLSGFNCFNLPTGTNPNEAGISRRYISLINATLPDDNVHSARTTYGWSILDFCATEIFEFALRLANGGQPSYLSNSPTLSQHRYEYAQMLDSFGGFGESVRAYCQSQPIQAPIQSVHPQPPVQIEPQPPVQIEPQPPVQVEPQPPIQMNVQQQKVAPMPQKPQFRQPEPKIEKHEDPRQPEPKTEKREDIRQPEPRIEKHEHHRQPEPRIKKHEDLRQPEPRIERHEDFRQQRMAPPRESQLQASKSNSDKQQKGGDNRAGSSGWLGGLISKVTGGQKEMILPDENKIPDDQKIIWDEKLGRYVGGVEEEQAPPPPPSSMHAHSNQPNNPNVANVMDSTNAPSFANAQSNAPNMPNSAMPSMEQPQQAARTNSLRRGPNRYSNAFAAAGGATTHINTTASVPSMVPDMTPPTFGFIPTAVDDDDQESPFCQSTAEPNQQEHQQQSNQ